MNRGRTSKILSIGPITLGAIGLTTWLLAIFIVPIIFPMAGVAAGLLAFRQRRHGDPLPIIGLCMSVAAILIMVGMLVEIYLSLAWVARAGCSS
jgi:hypothetical protein